MQKNINFKNGAAFTLILAILTLSGCGNEPRVPTNGTLLVGTSSISVTNPKNPPAGVTCSGITNGAGLVTSDFVIKITTLGIDGSPSGKIDVQISTDFAENTSQGGALTAVFVSDVGKGTDTLVSSLTDPVPFTTATDEFGELFQIGRAHV